MELDWLKKKHDLSIADRRAAIDPKHPRLSVARQCALVELPRSSFYYRPEEASEEDLELMRGIDEQYTATPFYGSRRMRWRSRSEPATPSTASTCSA